MGGPGGIAPEAALKILIHYGNIVNNFKFLKEVKIISEFSRINLDAKSKFMSAEGTPRQAILRGALKIPAMSCETELY